MPSYHNQLLYNGDETIPDFETAWRQTLDGTRGLPPSTCREAAFLNYPAVGKFDEQLQRYADIFPASQIMIMEYEDWTRDLRGAYLRLLSFLGVEDDGRSEFPKVHGAKNHRSPALARITQRPPGWVLAGARALKRLTGSKRLGVAQKLRDVNKVQGYNAAVSDGLKVEIDEYYEGSNIRLQELIRQIRQDSVGT